MTDKPRFRDAGGGLITDRRGLGVARVCVEGLKVADSIRVMHIILAALNADFNDEQKSITVDFQEGKAPTSRWL